MFAELLTNRLNGQQLGHDRYAAIEIYYLAFGARGYVFHWEIPIKMIQR